MNEEDNGQLFEPREYYNFNIIDKIQRGKRVGIGVLCLVEETPQYFLGKFDAVTTKGSGIWDSTR